MYEDVTILLRVEFRTRAPVGHTLIILFCGNVRQWKRRIESLYHPALGVTVTCKQARKKSVSSSIPMPLMMPMVEMAGTAPACLESTISFLLQVYPVSTGKRVWHHHLFFRKQENFPLLLVCLNVGGVCGMNDVLALLFSYSLSFPKDISDNKIVTQPFFAWLNQRESWCRS